MASNGFTDVRLRALHAPMYFGRDVDDACEFVTAQFGWLMTDLDTDARATAIAGLRANMAAH